MVTSNSWTRKNRIWSLDSGTFSPGRANQSTKWRRIENRFSRSWGHISKNRLACNLVKLIISSVHICVPGGGPPGADPEPLLDHAGREFFCGQSRWKYPTPLQNMYLPSQSQFWSCARFDHKCHTPAERDPNKRL